MKYQIVINLVLFLCIDLSQAAMTEKQVKAAAKLARNSCQPKTKAKNEDIEAMHEGNWDIPKSSKCYLNCIISLYRMQTKENTLSIEDGQRQLPTLPDSLRGYAEKTLDVCKDAAKTLNDKCEAAYEICHCMYLVDPEKYFLP